MLPREIKNFVDIVSQLPSIGPRQATRIAFYLLASGKNEIENLAQVVKGLEKLGRCPNCFFISQGSQKLCSICQSPSRDKQVIAIVEKETDLISLEKTGKYSGHYLVLGALAKNGILETEQQLRLKNLEERIKKEFKEKIKELIIALSPTTYGKMTAALIEEKFRPLAEKITRLACGMPTGSEIEFADEETLSSALEKRQ